MSQNDVATPEVLWAQRSSSADPTKNFVYLTISVPDVPPKNLKLELKPQGLTFTGHSDTLKKTYHLDIELFGEIDVDESKVHHTPKNVELKLRKKDLDEAYWPRLLKDSKKVHFLKTDFDKWVDEDEQNEAPEDDFSQFGGMGGAGDFGGIDFSKLGGSGGVPGEEEEEEEDDEDDEDMPALEGGDDDDDDDEEEAGAKAKGKAAA